MQKIMLDKKFFTSYNQNKKKAKAGDKMTKKIIIMVCMFFSIICLINFKVYADSPIVPGSYKPSSTTSVSGADTEMKSKANKYIGIVKMIGSSISVIALIVMGIKYMAGSVEEKAEYKKTMLPYVIGAVLIFGITNLLSVVQTIVEVF